MDSADRVFICLELMGLSMEEFPSLNGPGRAHSDAIRKGHNWL